MQLEYWYIKHWMKYEHMYEVIFNFACGNDTNDFFRDLVGVEQLI